MTTLDALFLLLALYTLGVAVVIGALHVWLRLDGARSPHGRHLAPLLIEGASAFFIQLCLPLSQLAWPWWWTRPTAPGAGARALAGQAASASAAPGEGAASASAAPGEGAAAGDAASPPPQQLPVVMVHGFAQNRGDFLVLGRRLRRAGRGGLYGFNYWSFGEIERSAARLARHVEGVCEATGATQVHLVAHSMGGIVSRYYAERLDGRRRVRTLTMIGSPHGGTRRASVGISAGARQLRPGSRLLETLGPCAPPEGARYHGVWSHADGLVVPASSASIGDAGEELCLRDHGHLQLLVSRRVGEAVIGWLEAAERERARDADRRGVAEEDGALWRGAIEEDRAMSAALGAGEGALRRGGGEGTAGRARVV